MTPPRPGLLTCLRRGALRRCPVCGTGRIFRTLLRLRTACPDCGWLVEREPGTVTGAMYVVAIFTQFFAVALWLGFHWTDWSVGVQLAVALPLIAGFSLLGLPVSKGLWIGVEYYTDVMQGETETPGYAERAFVDPRGGGGGEEKATRGMANVPD